jgi:hypothetical protein
MQEGLKEAQSMLRVLNVTFNLLCKQGMVYDTLVGGKNKPAKF